VYPSKNRAPQEAIAHSHLLLSQFPAGHPVKAAGAKVVVVGDTEQLQAIEAVAPMRAEGQKVGQITGKRSNGPPAQKVQSSGRGLI